LEAIYEYILAGIVILIILSVAEMNIFSVMTLQLTKMQQENENPVADRILDMILLSPGYPPNWGNQSTDQITSLGFAVQDALSSYELDISKVRRLNESVGPDMYIYPAKARQLMGLSEKYNFNLTMIPVFNINIVNASLTGQAKYLITIKDYKGFLVPNVNVTGFYVPNSFTNGEIFPSTYAITGTDGTCVLTFSPLSNYSLVVYANQLGVNAIQTYPPNLWGGRVQVEGGCVMESDFPIIQAIHCYTGSTSGKTSETASRYAEIQGVTYYVKFDLWS
jgi:hypothetical protein